jgi:single-strand DNA-binding protein
MANSTHHTGRLTADPVLRTDGELQICDMRLAVQRRRGKGGEDRGAFFIDLVAFNGLAGICHKYLSKGSRVLVDGQLDVQEWTGQDEVRRYTPKIIADQVEFLDPRPESAEASSEPSEEQSEPAKPRRRQRAKAAA